MSITIKDVKSCRGDWVFNDAWVTGLISDLCDLAEALQRENEALKQEKQDLFREVLRLSREEPEYILPYASTTKGGAPHLGIFYDPAPPGA